MSKPYALVSDQHFHQWHAFGSLNEDGVSTRLQFQLDELRRAANEVRAAGGHVIVNAGDTFHVRGSLAPSVLNPVLDLHEQLIREGFEIFILAGNHDLEGKSSGRLTSAATALEKVGCTVVSSIDKHDWNVAYGLWMVPWHDSVRDLKAALESIPENQREGSHLIIHAPVDGVLLGIPDHGLSGEYLAGLGFARVFSGHYHNHKEIVPGKVWSIGATAHQTWSDIGTKAGFLIVGDDVRWRKSHAPEFVQIAGDDDDDDVAAMVVGNYVRTHIDANAKAKDVAKLREVLESYGARGITLIPAPKMGAKRDAGVASYTATGTLDESVTSYVKVQKFENEDEVSKLCIAILNEARLAAATE